MLARTRDPEAERRVQTAVSAEIVKGACLLLNRDTLTTLQTRRGQRLSRSQDKTRPGNDHGQMCETCRQL